MFKCKDCGCVFPENCGEWSHEVVDEELIPLCPDCAGENLIVLREEPIDEGEESYKEHMNIYG